MVALQQQRPERLFLAAEARLAQEVDREEARRELDAALSEAGAGPEDSPAVKYARARLRAAGDQA